MSYFSNSVYRVDTIFEYPLHLFLYEPIWSETLPLRNRRATSTPSSTRPPKLSLKSKTNSWAPWSLSRVTAAATSGWVRATNFSTRICPICKNEYFRFGADLPLYRVTFFPGKMTLDMWKTRWDKLNCACQPRTTSTMMLGPAWNFHLLSFWVSQSAFLTQYRSLGNSLTWYLSNNHDRDLRALENEPECCHWHCVK